MKNFLITSAMLGAFAVSIPSGFAMVHGKAMTLTITPTGNWHSVSTTKHLSRRNLDGAVYAKQARAAHNYMRPKSFVTDKKKSSSSSSAMTSSTSSAMSSSAMSSSAMSSSAMSSSAMSSSTSSN